MRKYRYILLLITIILLITPINVLATNDEDDPAVTIIFTGAYNGSFVNTDSVIGMDIVSSIFQAEQAHSGAVFMLDCGDTIQGNFFSNSNQGEAAIDIMNTVGYDAMTLGNHEFDYGYQALLSLANTANFPFLTQPSVFTDNEPLMHTVIIERNGYKIGIFGLTTPATKQISYAFEKNFGDPSLLIDYAKKATTSLRESGADIVICLSHIGMAANLAHDFGTVIDIAENVLGIDVIIDGNESVEYDSTRAHTPIVCTSGNATLGMIKFYKEKSYFTVKSSIITKEDVIDVKSDQKVKSVIDKWADSADVLGKTVIGHSALALTDYDKATIRAQESALGNLVADAIRMTAGSEIAFVNAGSIRAPLNEGDITWSDVNNILPFSNYILLGTIKGSSIKEALEHSLMLRETDNGGGFLQVSGLTFSFNPDLPEYNKVTAIFINGSPLDNEQEYTLALPNFIADGGDGYSMFPDALANAVSKGDLTTILAQYIGKHSNLITNSLEGRIVITDEKTLVQNSSPTWRSSSIVIATIALLIIILIIINLFKRKKQKGSKQLDE